MMGVNDLVNWNLRYIAITAWKPVCEPPEDKPFPQDLILIQLDNGLGPPGDWVLTSDPLDVKEIVGAERWAWFSEVTLMPPEGEGDE